MKSHNRDIAFFLSWCIEEYSKVLKLDGSATMKLLAQKGILNYLNQNFEVLHTQGRQWIMEEITEKLNPHETLSR